MNDNIGQYITYADLLLEMAIANNTKVTKSVITLSNKDVDVGGDIYEYVVAGGDPTPKVFDIIAQSGFSDEIIEILTAPDRIRIKKTGAENVIANGPADLLSSITVPKGIAEQFIQQSMDLIDEKTGQYFNKRTGTFKFPGNNTDMLLFPVPIIEITKLLINSSKTSLTEGEDFDFIAFKGRGRPVDNRRNPKLILHGGTGRDIFSQSLTSRIFVKGSFSDITGSFGFLEPNGLTPLLIQKATKLLVMKEINTPIGVSASITSGTGPLKRLKVDLHEQEFFETNLNKSSIASSASGNEEVDRIVSMYRTPIRIGGSFKILKANEV